MMTSILIGATAIDCEVRLPRQPPSRLISDYASKGNVVGMSQVPVAHPQVPLMPDISKGWTAHQAVYKNLRVCILEEPENRFSGSRSEYESYTEVQ